VTSALVVVLAISLAMVIWVYFGYPLALLVLGRVRPAPRLRRPIVLPLTVVIAAHNEGEVIAAKVENVLSSTYPPSSLEVVVASDGSTDATVAEAHRAGATQVLDLPRLGKIRTLSAGAAAATGEILVFTDADSLFEPETLAALVSNFADPAVGGVCGNQVTTTRGADPGVARGEGLYWRYEHWLKRLEDRVGSTVSAAGGLYALRTALFSPPTLLAGADDFLISSEVVKRGSRLAFDDAARVLIDSPDESSVALRRKVRVMNGGLRAAFSLGRLLVPFIGGLYGFEVLSHKILRRLVPFFLVLALIANVWLAALEPLWLVLLAPQLLLYTLAVIGWAGRKRSWGRKKAVYVPYFFCLANLAAALAVLSLLRGVRFERWEPSRPESGQSDQQPA
jgi:cellulose synthase/poly-beta-1,6-N-acetylglucosamine synthase-like glycosyltransferase